MRFLTLCLILFFLSGCASTQKFVDFQSAVTKSPALGEIVTEALGNTLVASVELTFADSIKSGGYELYTNHFFDTVTIKTNEKTDEIYNRALNEKVNLRKVNDKTLSVAFDEAKRIDHVNLLLNIFNIKKDISASIDVSLDNIPQNLLRTSE